MFVIGELINASRKSVGEAIKAQDAGMIAKLAIDQRDNGADIIDVNAGIFVGREEEYLKWLVTTVQEAADVSCCIDTPDPRALAAALAIHRGEAMINSISLERKRYDAMLPLLSGGNVKVIALCMSDDGMPETVEQRLAIADKLVNSLVNRNVPIGNIYVDPLVQPVATSSAYGIAFLEAIERIMKTFPGIHTACGLSNISFGLPERKLLNRTFMVMAVLKGLDGAIINPLDRRMMAMIAAAEALAGKDDYCMKYLAAYRAEKLGS